MNWKVLSKDFYLLMFGKLTSLIGSDMQQFAIALFVLAKTGSATIFASLLAIAVLPRILLSPIAGVFGDWFDRKRTIVSLDILNGLIISGVGILYFIQGDLQLPVVYAVVILLEIIEIFFGSAMRAVVPSIVEKEHLVHANSIRSLIDSVGRLVAPLIAGIIYGIFGLQIILIVNAVSFFVSAISEMFIKIPKSHKRPEKITGSAFKNDLVAGIDIIRKNKAISSVIGAGTLINFSLAPLFSVGIIYIIKELLHSTDFQLGLFQAIATSAMIVAPLTIGKLFKKYSLGPVFVMGTIINGMLVLLLALVPTQLSINTFGTMPVYIMIAGITFCVSLVATVINICLGTLFDQVVPLEYMGRTGAAFSMVVTISIPIGQLIFGALYDYVPIYLAVSISGIIAIVGILIFRKGILEGSKADKKDIASKEEVPA